MVAKNKRRTISHARLCHCALHTDTHSATRMHEGRFNRCHLPSLVLLCPMDPPIKIQNGEVGDWRLEDEDFLKHFTLPGAANKHDRLAELNPLPRDGRILFDEACARA